MAQLQPGGRIVAGTTLAPQSSMAKMFAIVLLAAGILALAYGAVNYTEQAHEANVGPLDITVALGAVGGGLLVRRSIMDKGE